ncbi:MAG: GNAT family N-acetyltransferase [Solirubrobacteraceae bacterium]|nr:GNAT family N-acetyltransferase [Solirubrobacteraceae bacterium]
MPAVPSLTTPLTDGVVTLRTWEISDAPAMREIFLDDEMYRWTDAIPDEPLEEFERAIRRGWARGERGDRACFALIGPEGEVVGAIDLMFAEFERTEIGYAIARQARGNGYATRAVRILTDWAFSATSAERIELPIPVGNVRSRAVAERADYAFEGVMRSYLVLRDGGERQDVTMYARVRADGPLA